MNEQNLISGTIRTTSEAREKGAKGGRASGKKRRERKLIADALRQVLDEPLAKGSHKNRLDGISIKVIKKIFDDPDIRDVKVLAEILGELKQTIDASGVQINVTASPTGADNIKRMLSGE